MLRQKRTLLIAIFSSSIMVIFFYGYYYYLTWAKKFFANNLDMLTTLILYNIAPVIFGVLLGSLQLLLKPAKKFSINWFNLIIQGIPAFLIAFPSFFYLIDRPPLYISGLNGVYHLAGAWLGYVIISSLFKEKNIE